MSASNSVIKHFVAAARRHHSDAKMLIRAQKYANADHLAGFAAECSIKAVLIHHLGATATLGARPQSQHQGSVMSHGHLPGLWNELALVAAGRTGAQFATLTAGLNPFATWRVDDRYRDGAAITDADATRHLNAAAAIMGMYQLATISGSLP